MSHRRRLLQALGTATLVSITLRAGWAETYPVRPVRIIVGFAPGGNFDTVARVLAERMSDRRPQPVLVENRPGAASNIAAESVVRAPADGYVLFVGGAANAINATLYDKLRFHFATDLPPVASADQCPAVI